MTQQAVFHVEVEFFGLARREAGVPKTRVSVTSLPDLIQTLSKEFPQLATLCFVQGTIRDGWILNLNGTTFIRDLNTKISDGDTILLMSADVGG